MNNRFLKRMLNGMDAKIYFKYHSTKFNDLQFEITIEENIALRWMITKIGQQTKQNLYIFYM